MFPVLHSVNLFPIKKTAVDSKPTNKNQLYLRPISSVAPSCVSPSGSNPDTDLSPETLKNSPDSTPNQFFLPILSRGITVPGYEKVNLHERTEALFNLLRTHGVSDYQISKVLRSLPALLVADLEKDILPKLEFFKYIGVSERVLTRLITIDPKLLTRSLENRIVPYYDFLKSILKTDKKVVAAIKKAPWIFTAHHTRNLVPNIAFLREVGLEESRIDHALLHYTDAMIQNHWQFKEVVNQVKEMGFDMSTWAFLKAIHGLSGRGMRSLWDRCSAAYRKWGWSEDDIRSAYLKDPYCMHVSENKIARVIEFLTNKMGWPSNALARYPSLLTFSLENRTMPRFAVIKVLLSKGLLKEDMSWHSVSSGSEESFLEKYVTKYEKEVPELMSVYLGEVDIWESETENVNMGICLEGETTDKVQA